MHSITIISQIVTFLLTVHSNGQVTPTKPVVYRPTELILTKGTEDAMTSSGTFEGETMCVPSGSSKILGVDANVKIRYVDTKDSTPLAEAFTIHPTASSGAKLGVKLLTDKTKSIIFTVSDAYKVLLVGAKEDDCFKNYLVTSEEKKNQYVHLTYIKCFPLDEVAAYKKKSTTEDKKKYVLGTKHLCFLPSLVPEPICIEASDKTRSYTIIISPYPSPETKCTTTTSKPCPVTPANVTTNATETAKQSATPIIISVVVIVVVIIAGGVGYVMMKK